MAPNETTVLLTNYREKRNITSPRNGYGGQEREIGGVGVNSHIVHVSKDPAEYEPIFSIEEYSSALTLAELLPFQDDPWWQRFRRILMLAFWLILLMTFFTACTLSYMKVDQLSCQGVDPNLISTSLLTTLSSGPATTTASVLPPTIAKVVTTGLLDSNSKLSLAKMP